MIEEEPMEFQLATLWEILADAGPDGECLVAGEARHTRRSLDERANRLAHHFLEVGLGPGDRVGVYTYNRAEHIEVILACWKISAIAVNINYRYVPNELAHVWSDADLVAMVAERAFVPTLNEIAGDFAGTTVHLIVEDGSDHAATFPATSYEDALGAHPSTRDFGVARSEDDLYLIYTGGTTGLPKGVMWRHEDAFFATMGGGNYLEPISTPDQIAVNATAPPLPMNMMATAPLMHAAGLWVTMIAMFSGGKAVVYTGRSFDAGAVLDICEAEGSQTLALVGDAMALPIAEAMEAGTREMTGLFAVSNGGAMISASTRNKLTAAFPGRILSDGFGSSETGTVGSGANTDPGDDGSRFSIGPTSAVVDPDTLEPVEVGQPGIVARTGHVPIGYMNDEGPSTTFVTSETGQRWVLTGDHAMVEDDGRVLLLGRGSSSINSGGEKIFPEEVEAACRSHPAVGDVIVTGVSDERWGAKVVAVVEVHDQVPLELEELQSHCRGLIAGYKIPRELVFAPIRHTNVGKPDLVWAREFAATALSVHKEGR